jgi:hypothetical protein
MKTELSIGAKLWTWCPLALGVFRQLLVPHNVCSKLANKSGTLTFHLSAVAVLTGQTCVLNFVATSMVTRCDQRTKVGSCRSEAHEGFCKGKLESSVHVEMSTKCNTYVQSFCWWGHHVHDTVMRTQMSRPELNTSGCKGEYCNKHETVDKG